MGFEGFVIGDWNGHEQVEGCSKSSCSKAINAGVDMIMVPTDWKAFLENTVKQVRSGEISEDRINDAVRRILRVKINAGMFEHGKPSEHILAGRANLLGHPQHRSIARQAVRESLVLLKNDNVLPFSPSAKVIVDGSGAHNPQMQSGGWTLDWQGRDVATDQYKGFTTIRDGFEQVLEAQSGEQLVKRASRAEIAIIVFGETPYAEMQGDLTNTDFDLSNSEDFKLMKKYKARGIPVIAVMLSGRPRGVDDVIEISDAFVAAWLPGSEGGGVADVLIDNDHSFVGTLPFDWPKTGAGTRFERGFALYLNNSR